MEFKKKIKFIPLLIFLLIMVIPLCLIPNVSAEYGNETINYDYKTAQFGNMNFTTLRSVLCEPTNISNNSNTCPLIIEIDNGGNKINVNKNLIKKHINIENSTPFIAYFATEYNVIWKERWNYTSYNDSTECFSNLHCDDNIENTTDKCEEDFICYHSFTIIENYSIREFYNWELIESKLVIPKGTSAVKLEFDIPQNKRGNCNISIGDYEIDPVLTDGLVAWYKLENDCNDSSGQEHNATGANIDYESGKYGVCGSFNESENSDITVDDHNDFSFTDGGGVDEAFTVAFWVYKDPQVGDIDNTIFYIYKRASSVAREWGIYEYPAGTLAIVLTDPSYSNYLRRNVNDPIPHEVWTHVAVTYNGSETTESISLYIDGVLTGTSDASNGNYVGMTNGAADIKIGDHINSLHGLTGEMDEIAIWKDRELNITEINEVMNNGLAGGAEDTCTCAGAGTNWEIDLLDYCAITSLCNLTMGNLTFINTGWVNFTNTLQCKTFGNLANNQIVYLNGTGNILIG